MTDSETTGGIYPAMNVEICESLNCVVPDYETEEAVI